MQILHAHPLSSLPVTREAAYERPTGQTTNLLAQPANVESRRATRSVEEIHSAERMLSRQRSQNSHDSLAQVGRQQRAVTVYQSMQQSDERAYVSEVLGIDVYA
jgi:hypothetical protein